MVPPVVQTRSAWPSASLTASMCASSVSSTGPRGSKPATGSRAEPAQPARQLRAERVPDPALAGRSGGQQLVAEDDHADPGLRGHGQRVVPAGRREPDVRPG